MSGDLLRRTVDTALDRAILPGYSRIGYALRSWTWASDDPPVGALAGRTAVVTGANSGLGKATVAGLARLRAAVVMVVRDRGRGEAARAEVLRGLSREAELAVEVCDVSDLDAVRAFVAARRGALDVLIHNAGVLPDRRSVTAQGNEIALSTHVLGPFLLTALLRPALSADGGGRVVFISSGGMYAQRLRSDDMQYKRGGYDGTAAYARTKRMQVVLVEEWARRLAPEGVVVQATHPGWASTPGVVSSLPGFYRVMRPLLRTPDEGADTAVWLAAASEPGRSSGRFWHDRRARPTHYVSWTRETAEQRAALWEACVRLTGVG